MPIAVTRRTMGRRLASAVLLALVWALPLPAQEPSGLPLSGEAAETFLRTAEVVRKRRLGIGITLSDRYTLSDGSGTHDADFKTIDQMKRGVSYLEGGGSEITLLNTSGCS